MARYFRQGVDLRNTDLDVWSRIDREFEDQPDEHRAARVLYRFTGIEPFLWDTAGRQRASDIVLRHHGKLYAVVEVSSTHDTLLRRDMNQAGLFESEMNEGYSGRNRWVLLLQRGWDIPSVHERRAVANDIRQELQARTSDGYLSSIDNVFAYPVADGVPGIEIGGWNSRVPVTTLNGSEHLAAFLDTEIMRRKRSKLTNDAISLDAPSRQLFLHTTPTGSHAHVATTSTWDLADGTFVLPDDLDEVWLDSGGLVVRRFTREGGWTEYAR